MTVPFGEMELQYKSLFYYGLRKRKKIKIRFGRFFVACSIKVRTVGNKRLVDIVAPRCFKLNGSAPFIFKKHDEFRTEI